MTSPASPTTEPPVFELGTLKIAPAAGLEQIQVLPFSTANFKKAVTDRLRALDGGDDTQLWIVFSDFDCSKLKYVDQLRYPIRLQLDDSKLIVKMVGPVHEMMHNSLMDSYKETWGAWAFGLFMISPTLDQAGTNTAQTIHSKKRIAR